MVLRKSNVTDGDPGSFSDPVTSADMSAPSTYHTRALQSDVAALHLGPPDRVPSPPPDLSDHEDSNSDWDASEREDEGDAPAKATTTTKSRANQPPAYAPPPGPPPGRPAPLSTNLATGARPEDELMQSPWADNDGLQSATSTRPNNNPFRRPTDYTPSERVDKHASVWNALGTGYASTQPNQPALHQQAPAHLQTAPQAPSEPASSTATSTLPPQPSESNLIDLDPSNPWDEASLGASKGKQRPSAPSVDPANPWDDQIGKAPPTVASVEARTGIDQLQDSDAGHAAAGKPESGPSKLPAASVADQKNEIYQVRRIRWFDPRSKKTLRESPVLIQNANGPCPLLALVNALALSTPPGLQTELIRTLQHREQISLGLLIDAVFEELMSGRRGSTAQGLPDVSELYSFLVTLHTGMNVNPRFVEDASADIARVGTFERTREMKLYSTFAVPLIHGWVPAEHEGAYAAFARTAPSYEDAQNVQFREEEIEQKLGTSSISEEEQNVLVDLASIKQYFADWPTQLTQHGLESIKQELEAGSIAILFRNDHFSTLYKEPKTKQLMSLVTDAGYASHDEIVWESLVDISGQKSEMFSGDFRCVSHGEGAGRDGGQWSTVPAKQGRKEVPLSSGPAGQTAAASHGRSQSEQEDHDLALAMQLQEEEDQRHRSQQAARRRENELSQQFLSGDAPEQRPQIPPRRSNRATTHRAQEDPELPTYEQAAATRPYRPPQGHPSSEYVPGQDYQESGITQSSRRQRGRSSVSGPFDNTRRYQSEYDSFAERREGCSMM